MIKSSVDVGQNVEYLKRGLIFKLTLEISSEVCQQRLDFSTKNSLLATNKFHWHMAAWALMALIIVMQTTSFSLEEFVRIVTVY